MEQYSIREIIKNIAEKYNKQIADKGLFFRITIEEEVPDLYVGNSEHFCNVLDCLLQAAILRTNEGRIAIHINIHYINKEKESVILFCEVVDTGFGVKEDDYQQIRSFFQSDETVNIDSVADLGTNISFFVTNKAITFDSSYEYVFSTRPIPPKKAIINVQNGLKYNGNDMSIYLATLQEYIKEWGVKKRNIDEAFEFGDWENYRILVHGIKSGSYAIGALSFGNAAKKLELAARDLNSEFIFSNHISLMEQLDELLSEGQRILADNGCGQEVNE